MRKEAVKKAMVVVALLFGGSLYAQNFNEWFRQKRTQRRYLMQQIVALQAYIELAKKTYGIIDEGTDMISSIRNGDWKQFIDYFGSLEAVNPIVKKYHRTNDIVQFNRKIVELYRLIYKPLREDAIITEQEWKMSDLRFEAILKSSLLNLQEAEDLITPGVLTMKDDERLKRIDYIYANMATNYSLAWHICDNIIRVSDHRQLTVEQMEAMKKIQL
jgi:hypothetical protein